MYQFVIALLYLTIVGLFVVCAISLSKWGGMHHTYLFFYCVSNLIYNCAYILMMHADNQETYVTALKIGYLGRAWVALSMTMFIAKISGRHFPTLVKAAAGILNVVVYFFILNLERTHLYYKTMKFVMDGDFPTLPHSGGPLYYFYTLTNLFYSYACVYMIVKAFIHEKNKTAKKRDLMIMFSLAALVTSYLIYYFKLIPLARKFDTMIIGYAICTAFMLIAIIKYKMLDTAAAAKNYVVDELSEGIIAVDVEDRLNYINKPALKLFPELADQEKEPDTQRVLATLNEAINRGEPVRLDGRIYTPRVNPLTEEGLRIGTLYSLSDDSDHYRYMDELREQKKIADEANRSKSQFLANMSHEIRTPINAVLGFNEMITRECAKMEEGGEAISPAVKDAFGNIGTYSGNIEGAGNNLLSIINDILDISKIEAGKMELTDGRYSLGSLLKDITGMISFRASEKNLAFVADVDEKLPDELFGDMVRIRQVIINILTNAVKYTEKGTVWLTVNAGGKKDLTEGGTLPLTIVVKDTGIGIRPEDMDKLFGSFERFELKRNSTIEGTGLGLAISHQLVSMMDGKIEVESEYGEGSTFTIVIPQKIISCEPVGKLGEHEKAGNAGKKRHKASFAAPDAVILVVDDTHLNLKVATALLKDTGLKIDTAESGKRALELADTNKYDVILMDQRMPNMDGTETLRHIRATENALNVKTPVICMTADAIIGSRERYIAEGFDDYLSKPIKVAELEETLIKYLPADKVTMVESADGT